MCGWEHPNKIVGRLMSLVLQGILPREEKIFAVLSFSHRCIFGANSALEIIRRKMPEARQDLEWLVIYYPCVQSL